MSLFGLDIQSLVTDSLTGQLKPITITRTTQQYNPATDATTTTTQTYTTEGIAPSFSSMAGKAQMLQAGLITSTEVPILMLAKPLGTEPLAGDKIEIEDKVYTITGIIEKDPASATWTVRAEQ